MAMFSSWPRSTVSAAREGVPGLCQMLTADWTCGPASQYTERNPL